MLSHAALCRLALKTSRKAGYAPEVIRRILRYGAPVGHHLEHHHHLSRCMDQLRSLVHDGKSGSTPATGIVVRADELSDSSGRFSRSWHAPPGGLYLALLWADTLLSEFSRQLPLAAGIACCETILSFGPRARIKWVNDVLVADKKISGILSEVAIGADDERFHLIGIGINVNNTLFPEELQGKATALRIETGRHCNLDKVCSLLLARLQWNLGLLYYAEERWMAGEGRGEMVEKNLLLERWRQLSDTLGRFVLYGYDVEKKPLYQAEAMDIDATGGLILELADGSRITEYSGEVLYI